MGFMGGRHRQIIEYAVPGNLYFARMEKAVGQTTSPIGYTPILFLEGIPFISQGWEDGLRDPMGHLGIID